MGFAATLTPPSAFTSNLKLKTQRFPFVSMETPVVQLPRSLTHVAVTFSIQLNSLVAAVHVTLQHVAGVWHQLNTANYTTQRCTMGRVNNNNLPRCEIAAQLFCLLSPQCQVWSECDFMPLCSSGLCWWLKKKKKNMQAQHMACGPGDYQFWKESSSPPWLSFFFPYLDVFKVVMVADSVCQEGLSAILPRCSS